MRRQIIGVLLAFATASAFAADAPAPQASATTAATTASAPSAPASSPSATAINDSIAAKAESPKNNYRGYKLVKRNGEEKYCRKQPVLGSRTKVVESCLTLEEMAVMRETGQDMVDRLGRMPGAASGMDGGGGMNNSAISPMGQ